MEAPPHILMKFPLLQLGNPIGLTWADWLRDQGATLPVVTGPAFPTFSLLLLELVAARGIALGYKHIVDQLLIDRRVVRLSTRFMRSGLGFYAVCRDPASIPIQTIIGLFRKGIAAQSALDGAVPT
jgi:DNA-binding transcriptional LysR family regulator